MATDRISKLLEDIRLLDSERFELVQALRKLVLGLAPSISEEVKYGGIMFSDEKPFCGIFSYAKHVSLEFSEGEGKLRRHIKLTSVPDIAGKQVGEYLLLALRASPKR